MRTRSLLALALLIGLFFIKPISTQAQAPSCASYGNGNPWTGVTVITGSFVSGNILSSSASGNALVETDFNLNALYSGPRYTYSIDFFWFATPATHYTLADAQTILTASAGGTSSDVIQEDRQLLSSQQLIWVHTTFYFAQLPADHVHILLLNQDTTAFLTLGEVHICSNTAIQLTSTPSSTPSTTPSPTSGASPTRTNTPLPPTATLTPTPSNTPISVGGLTVTASLTMTLAASPGPTLGIGKAIFATVPAPDQCSDAFNPCGALPYPVPPLATLNLPSPTAVPITPFAGTPGAGTPTGTSTGTPTLESTTGAVVQSFATNAQAAVQQIEITPGLNGPPGTGIGISDLNNTAHQVGSYVGDFFGIIRAIQFFFLGKTGTLIAFLILILLFIILVRLICWAIPIVSNFAKFIIWIIGAIIP